MKSICGFFLLPMFFFVSACSHNPVTSARDPQASQISSKQKDTRISELRQLAHSFYKRGDYLRAIPHLELILHMNDSAVEAEDRFILGYSYLVIGEGAKAEEVLRSAIQTAPYLPVGYQLLGLASLIQGKASPAAEVFRRGLEFDTHPPKMHYYLGLALHKLGKTKERDAEFSKAEEEYEKILVQNAQDFGANFELAYLYATLGHKLPKVQELIENARSGLKDSDPDLVEGGTLYQHFYLPMLQGLGAFRENKSEKASELLLQAALASPLGAKADLAEIFHYLSLNENARGKKELATSLAEAGKILDPQQIVPLF